jgi:hypothetical protein
MLRGALYGMLFTSQLALVLWLNKLLGGEHAAVALAVANTIGIVGIAMAEIFGDKNIK